MKKLLSSGTRKSSSIKKAPDKTGAYIDVQKKALGTMKCGGKMAKKKGK